MYTKQILKNGLTILQVRRPERKSVLVDIFVKTGSRHESARVNGISHFLEHVFFKGSKKYPTAQELSHALDAIGAEYNANTGKEHTQFYIKAAKKHFGFIFETLTDMLQNPVFAEEEIEREKGVIIEEINMYEDTPMRHVEDLLEEAVWPDQPLGRNIAGTREVIRKISRADIADYVQTFYQPKNMIMAVTGAYSEQELEKYIRKYWAKVPSRRFPKWEPAYHRQKLPVLKMEHKKTEQYHLALGFRSYDFNHKYFVAQMILATILGGGMSSRLFSEIRERRGLAYYVRATPTNYQDTGLFVVQAGVRLEAFVPAVETIMAELRKIKNEIVPERELVKAKEYLKGTLTLSLEDSESLLGWYLEQIAFRKKILEPEDSFALIDAVSADLVRTVARDIFQSRKLNMTTIGPAKGRPALAKLLRI